MPENASRSILEVLEQKVEHYRSWTRDGIAKAPDAWIYRPAGWTECTIGWHMGHLSWKLDSYAELYLGLPATLDAEWQRLFYSEAPLDPAQAPPLAELKQVFASSHQRFIAGLAPLADADLLRANADWPDGTILGAIANVIMHEGEHLAGVDALIWKFTQDNATGASGHGNGAE